MLAQQILQAPRRLALTARPASVTARPAWQCRFDSTKATPPPLSSRYGPPDMPDNLFNRERAAIKAHAAESSDLWRRLMLYVAAPCLILSGYNAWILWNEHWEHWAHEPPLDERPQYDYLNIRNKKYPWGDGDKTLFWNPKVNYHKKEE